MPNRIYAQYKDKPKAVAWYGITPTLALELSDVYELVRVSYNIDTVGSGQLDVIGQIVVIDKPYNSVNDLETYRALLRSKIVKNTSDATIDGIIKAMQFIVPDNIVTVSDFEDMSMDVAFGLSLTPAKIDILNSFNLVPKPQGVRFKGYAVLPLSTIYGADDAQYGNDDDQYGFYFGGS